MIHDAGPGFPRFEGGHHVCILGAGPAGITLALRLAEAGRRVLLLEGGGAEFSGESQDLYQGESVGYDYGTLDSTRLRYLGGTSGHWGGQCLLLDPADFEPRPDLPLSGWPIRHADLAPWRDAAADILQTSRFPAHVRRPLDGSDTLEEVTQRFSSDRAFLDLRDNEPVRFGTRYRADLAAAEGIDLVLNANAVGFDVAPDSGRITAVRVRNHGAGAARYGADHFVLAMGGIENVRMLLHLNAEHANRFGNRHGMVGRCFMDHPVLHHGSYFITRRLFSHSHLWELERLFRRAIPELLLGPRADHARRAGWLNATLRFSRLNRAPLDAAAVGDTPFIRDLRFGEDYFHRGTVSVMGEQAPNPASRVLLTGTRDRFGLRRVALDWRLLPIDIETLRGVSVEGAKWLIRSGLGRMQIEPLLWDGAGVEALPVGFSSHHMGGARMSATPETGVVDADCRVHGVANLHVAGSAVFATSGHANPTFTIVQLALRLADHLAGKAG